MAEYICENTYTRIRIYIIEKKTIHANANKYCQRKSIVTLSKRVGKGNPYDYPKLLLQGKVN